MWTKVEDVIDQAYLRTRQYADAANLNARVAIHARFSVNKQPWQRWVFERLELGSPCTVLELGCGPGNLWRDNAERLPAGLRLVLTDFSAGMVEQAQRNLAGVGGHALAVADAQHLPFADRSFAVAIANHMLYHVPDRPRTLAEVRRELASGGRFYAATVGGRHMRELDELVARFDPRLAETGIGLGKPYVPFSLDNGGEQLAQVFAHVELQRYDDALEVTEAAPLAAYIASGTDRLSEELLAALTAFVQAELDRRGVIHIGKESGLFVAW